LAISCGRRRNSRSGSKSAGEGGRASKVLPLEGVRLPDEDLSEMLFAFLGRAILSRTLNIAWNFGLLSGSQLMGSRFLENSHCR
jgi:hypothetical protein